MNLVEQLIVAAAASEVVLAGTSWLLAQRDPMPAYHSWWQRRAVYSTYWIGGCS